MAAPYRPDAIARWESLGISSVIAARLMRLILVDYALAHHALKRGGEAPGVTLEEVECFRPAALRRCLRFMKLWTKWPKWMSGKGKVIEMRYFGMKREEIATAPALTLSTVKLDLRLGEPWLRRFLSGVNRP